MNRYSPYTCSIQGDISRADAVCLTELCDDRRVVEFGVGASTMVLSRCARTVLSYDTDPVWLEKTKVRLVRMPDKVCSPELRYFEEVPEVPECDVLWIDGLVAKRQEFTEKNFARAKELVILHGALRNGHSYGQAFLPEIMNKFWEMIETIELGYRGSHLLVLKKRRRPLRYYNYHETEAHNHRLPA